jgi:hypothetical protein
MTTLLISLAIGIIVLFCLLLFILYKGAKYHRYNTGIYEKMVRDTIRRMDEEEKIKMN